MARKRKIKRSGKTSRRKKSLLAVLPESVQAFLARRLHDGFAVLLSATGISLFLAFLSYDHRDPSWNTASVSGADTVHNWMGAPGAWAADLILQTLGAAGLLLAFGLIVWSVRSFRREPLKPVWLRVIALLFSAVAASIALAKIPSGDWTVHPYLGSAAGTLLLNKISTFSHLLGGIGVPGLAAGAAGLAFAYAAAITRQEIWIAALKIRNMIAAALLFLASLASAFIDWVRHYNDPDYTPEPLALFRTKRPPKVKKEPVVSSGAGQEKSPPPTQKTRQPAPTSSIPVVSPKASKNQTGHGAQQKFNLQGEEWDLPALSLLQAPPEENEEGDNEESLRKNAILLQNVLADFNIEGEVVSIHPGPVVTLYEFEPAPGTKTSRVISLSDDIARSMSAISVRIAVVPGRSVIGIELPNAQRQIVYMREMLASRLYEKSKARLPLILGKDISGQPVMADLAKMPHLLVAGTTGSGKSVAINIMILSLIFRLPPEKCRMIMIDPKMLELSVYDDIPHLLSPVVTEPGEAVVSLKWAVMEMEERYRAMSKLGVRNIEGYNARLKEAREKGETIMNKVQTGYDSESGKPVYEEHPMDMNDLPYIVIVVDEFADLMLVAGKDVENAIQRLAQMARAAGIHLIMATQRPSVDVITGVVKANFPTRISFQVTSKVDSRTILGEGGAEQLLGMGDMLYMAPGGRLTRVHGPFVSDEDVENVTEFLRSQGDPAYVEEVTEGGSFGESEIMAAMFGEESDDEKVDELYDKAVALVAREGKASTSFVQRHMQVGYNRAARMIEEMERQGVISPATATGKREVLIRDFSDV